VNYKKGIIAPILIVGLLIVGLFITLLVFGSQTGDGFGILSFRKNDQTSEASSSENITIKDISSTKPAISPEIVTSPSPVPTQVASPIVSPVSSPTASTPVVYTQPQGKYTITLPSGWIVESTTATTTYSTTIFSGIEGNISITFGSGKDPLGGCSDTTIINLADRTINGCLYLQKDGSRILTRGYTEDVTGIPFTIEALINPDLSINQTLIFSSIATINIE